MSAPQSLLLLPLELLIIIVKQCRRYSWPEGPIAEHIQSLCNSQKYDAGEEHHLPWPTLLEGAVKDICNVRSVCTMMKTAAGPSFGSILEGRSIRLTETGLEDLKAISNNPEFAPCVKNLTFENTHYVEYVCHEPNSAHKHVCHEVNTEMFRNTSSATKISKKHKPLPTQEVQEQLIVIFDALPKLEGVRIIAPTEENLDVVIAWKKPASTWCSAIKQNEGDSNAYVYYNDDANRDNNERQVLLSRGCDIATTVFGALSQTNTNLREFQVNSTFWLEDFGLELLPDILRVLRISVVEDELRTGEGNAHKTSLVTVLKKLTNLEDLALSLAQADRFERAQDYRVACEMESDAIFAAVEGATKLRRFALEGDWAYNQNNFRTFLEQHASSLRCLILYGGALNGIWLELLQTMAGLTPNHLKYLSIKFVYEVRVDWSIEWEDFNEYTVSQWPEFGCATDFGPWHSLLEDADDVDEEDEEDENMPDAEDDDSGEYVEDDDL